MHSLNLSGATIKRPNNFVIPGVIGPDLNWKRMCLRCADELNASYSASRSCRLI
jgi:hypothetical protein